MSKPVGQDMALFKPALKEYGWKFETANLFMIEGATVYPWLNAEQNQQVWKPDVVTQECGIIGETFESNVDSVVFA